MGGKTGGRACPGALTYPPVNLPCLPAPASMQRKGGWMLATFAANWGLALLACVVGLAAPAAGAPAAAAPAAAAPAAPAPAEQLAEADGHE